MDEYDDEYVSERVVYLRHRHFIVLLQVLVVILLCILIAGCTGSSATTLYLVELKYSQYSQSPITATGIVNQGWYSTMNTNVGDADVVTRIGFFGICTNSSALQEAVGGGWRCTTNATQLIDYFTIATEDPMNLIYLSTQLRAKTYGGWTIIIALVLTFLDMFLVMFSRPSQAFALPVAAICCALAFIFAVLGVTWQQVAASTTSTVINNFTQHAVTARYGMPAAGLGWSSVVFLFICNISLILVHYYDRAIVLENTESGMMAESPPRVVEVSPGHKV
jgi:hypothetical protein